MIRFCLLASGSSGNALLIAAGQTKILIDNGLSYAELARRAAMVGETLTGVQAVFVTHEHADHVRGLGVAARRLKVPVYMTHGTREFLPKSVGPIPQVIPFDSGDAIRLDGIAVQSFAIAHDAADPVGFTIEGGNTKIGLACDMGRVTNLVRSRLSGSQALILESNYCPDLLRTGPYPVALQQRISGTHGHLSNEASQALLEAVAHKNLRLVVLAHMSSENNTPRQARVAACRALLGHPAELFVARRDRPTRVFEVWS